MRMGPIISEQAYSYDSFDQDFREPTFSQIQRGKLIDLNFNRSDLETAGDTPGAKLREMKGLENVE